MADSSEVPNHSHKAFHLIISNLTKSKLNTSEDDCVKMLTVGALPFPNENKGSVVQKTKKDQ